MMIHRNLEFEAALCADLASAFNDAHKCASKKTHSFVTSLNERYAEAFAHGAHFYGPLAVIPSEGSKWWQVKDMRHGWGYHPLDIEVFAEEGKVPTLEDVLRTIKSSAHTFRARAKDMDALVESFHKP